MTNKRYPEDMEHARTRKLLPAAVSVLLPVALAIAFLVMCGIRSCHAKDVSTRVIAQMESQGDVFARNGHHYGLCQISRGVLKDYNLTHRTVWHTVDLYNGVINLRIAAWYLNQEIPRMLKAYGMADTLTNRLTAWRLGIKSILSNTQAKTYTKNYLKLKEGM
jgi:hypothetical protein